MQRVLNHQTKGIEFPHSCQRVIPERLVEICKAMTAKAPQDRFQTAADAVAASRVDGNGGLRQEYGVLFVGLQNVRRPRPTAPVSGERVGGCGRPKARCGEAYRAGKGVGPRISTAQEVATRLGVGSQERIGE